MKRMMPRGRKSILMANSNQPIKVYLDTSVFNRVFLESENDKNPFPLRKRWVNYCFNFAQQHQKINENIKSRAKAMEAQAIKPIDALHVACAEAAGCDYFLTCDDRIVKRYKENIQVNNPVNFILLLTETSNESKNAQ